MSTRHRWSTALFALSCAASWHLDALAEAPASAATQRPTAIETLPPAPPLKSTRPAAEEKAAEKTERGEPAVRKTVVEDDSARIDELKVRGQTKRITVTPKKGGKPYEIIPPNGGPDQTEGPNGSNGAVGKRVWPVLSF